MEKNLRRRAAKQKTNFDKEPDKNDDYEVKGTQKPTTIHSPKPVAKSSTLGRYLLQLLLLTIAAGGIYLYYSYILFDTPNEAIESVNAPFKVVEIPGKGTGVVAARDISQGELILRDRPLFIVPTRVQSTSPGALLLSELARLTPAQRASFYNLSYVNMREDHPPGSGAYDEELALAIFQTNAVSAGEGVGIFPQMARLNHGCSSAFNSVYSWREDEDVIVVHALKSVKAGDELLTTYTNSKQPRAVRREFLRQHYGFECQCSVCSLSDELSNASDARLARMTELYSKFSTWQHKAINGKEAIKTALKIWKLGEEEGYWSERGQLAADAAWVAAAHSDAISAPTWAQLARKWYSYELGADSEQVRSLADVVAYPWRHPAWGTRETMFVGGPPKDS